MFTNLLNYFTSFIKMAKLRLDKLNHLDLIIVFLLFLIGFLLRAYLINENLFFGFEQGRDLLVVRDIVENHKLVLIGSQTDINGIFHGPLFYYLMVIPFILSKGNPIFISLCLIFVSSLSIYFIYLLGKELFNRKVGLISAALLTFSFGSMVMARWFSNPPLTIPISCLFFLFLVKFLKGKKYYLIAAAILFGFTGQVEFINYLILAVALLLVIIFNIKLFLKTSPLILLTSFVLLIITSVTNYILFDLRHNFLITNSLVSLLTKGRGFYVTFAVALSGTISNFFNFYLDTSFPLLWVGALVIFIFSILSLVTYFKSNKIGSKVLAIWISSPLLIFVLLRYVPLYHYFVVIGVGITILTALLVNKVWQISKLLGTTLFLFIILINIIAWLTSLPTNKNVFFQSTQPDLKYSDQILVINRIYKQANGQPFYFQAYTIPYWVQQGWEYLFWYYGKNVYGFVPINNHPNKLFVIIQNDPNNVLYQNNWLKNTVSKWGKKTGEFKYGALKVQILKTK